MTFRLRAALALFGLSCILMPGVVLAGWDEGWAAIDKNDFATAFKEFKPLASQGDKRAQYAIGVMYDKGQGVLQDFKEAVKWYRLAADQGNALAQNNLGWMYANGDGVSKNRVVAYALYNLSAAKDPSQQNNATANRTKLADEMPKTDIDAAQTLSREMAQPGNLLKALDKYLKNPAIKEKPMPAVKPARDSKTPTAPLSGDGFPSRPAKRPGVVSCNTNCVNADCRRTYDDGQKVRFQAKRQYDPLSGEWKFDPGNC